jgi:proteic killer suppression protein
MEIFKVVVSKKAAKDLAHVPQYIVLKLQMWCEAIGASGLRAIQKMKGYHDEPLKGKRLGQRSIRLSKGYRAIYSIDESNVIHFLEVIEVHKHDY